MRYRDCNRFWIFVCALQCVGASDEQCNANEKGCNVAISKSRPDFDLPLEQAKPCDIVDGRTLTLQSVNGFTRPTIITNVLDKTIEDWRNWSRSEFLRNHGDYRFYWRDLRFDSVGAEFFSNNVKKAFPEMKLGGNEEENIEAADKLDLVLSIERPTLRTLLDHNGARNFFLLGPGKIRKSLKSRNTMWQELGFTNRTAFRPPLRKLLNPLGTNVQRSASFGARGQWNTVHSHGRSVFTLVNGQKGWVFAPRDDQVGTMYHMPQDILCGLFGIPEAKADLKEKAQSALKNVDITICRLDEGESIFFPADWMHGTCNLGSSFNAGFTYIDPDSLDA